MKKCPFCAEEIQDEAVICHFCGRHPDDMLRPSVVKRLNKWLLGGCVAVLLLAGIAVVIAKRTTTTVFTKKSATTFMGYAVSLMPSFCNSDDLFADAFQFKTTTCLLEDGEKYRVYAQYMDDDAAEFRSTKGMLLKAYVVLKRSVTSDEASKNAFLDAFQEKYGRFDVEDSLNLCQAAGQPCRLMTAMLDAQKQYSSRAAGTARFLYGTIPWVGTGGNVACQEVAIFDMQLFWDVGHARDARAASDARALVK